MKLLFVTPNIDETHDDLAFAALWARAFSEADYDVEVVCLRKGKHALPFPVYSLGKERGSSNWVCFLRFWWHLLTHRYDRVFVHMSAPLLAAGSLIWWLRGTPVYMWYTHYTLPWTLRIGSCVVKRFFAATKESLPHFDGDPRKIVTGHGIDTAFWEAAPPVAVEDRVPASQLLAVHRISRSKRLDLVIRALALLPESYTLTHYGRPMGPEDDVRYERELHVLVQELGLGARVRFMGSVPGPEVRTILPRYQTFVNLVPQTIDKSVLEAMYCGLTPVIGRGQAEAIGFPEYPADDTPARIAEHIRYMRHWSQRDLQALVRERHGLARLVGVLSEFIRPAR